MKILFIGWICFSIGFVNAQTGEDYLKLMQANYKDVNAMQINMQYTLYKGYDGQAVIEEYKSVYNKLGNASYRKINRTEIINNEGVQVKINHDQKVILVSELRSTEAIDIDFSQILKRCESISLSQKSNHSVVHLDLKVGQDIPYTRISIEVNSKFLIQKVTLYYATKINFSNDYLNKDLDFPKLVIQYNEFKQKWKDQDEILTIKNYVKFKGSQLVLNERYTNYQIIDLRRN